MSKAVHLSKGVGRLEAIWVKRARMGPMDPVNSAELLANRGIVGNADQGRKRQVTLIEREKWREMMAELSATADPALRRANLMISGISLNGTNKRILTIGECRIRIWGETRPCERMDDALHGLRGAMQTDWRGGAFGIVLDDGRISVGDRVAWVNE